MFSGAVLSALLINVSVLVMIFGLRFSEVLSLIPTMAFVLLILVSRACGLCYEIIRRDMRAVISSGVLIIILGLLVNNLYGFEGTAAAAEGEKLAEYNEMKKGAISKPFVPDILISEIPGDPFNPREIKELTVLNAKNEAVILFPGKSVSWPVADVPLQFLSAVKVELSGIWPAPRFLIRDGKGGELHSAYVKLRIAEDGSEDYFRSPSLVHRFYVGLTGDGEKPLRVKAARGKLMIKSADLELGEEMVFENLSISFPEITNWAIVKVKYYPGSRVISAGVLVMLTGIVLLLSVRRKA